jgi:transcription antitermination factor NusG
MAKPCSFCSIETIQEELMVSVSHQWFAVYTRSCQEKKVAQHLSIRDMEYFLPVKKSVRRWNNGCAPTIEQPLFPGYLFVKIQRNERVRVLELPGVHSIVGNGKEPISLPSAEIEALRRAIPVMNVEPCAYLSVGEQARIKHGPLQGMTGIIVRKKNGLRFVLSLDLIMKSVSVEVDAQDLEATEHFSSRHNLAASAVA